LRVRWLNAQRFAVFAVAAFPLGGCFIKPAIPVFVPEFN
jgi:hypothetical protein